MRTFTIQISYVLHSNLLHLTLVLILACVHDFWVTLETTEGLLGEGQRRGFMSEEVLCTAVIRSITCPGPGSKQINLSNLTDLNLCWRFHLYVFRLFWAVAKQKEFENIQSDDQAPSHLLKCVHLCFNPFIIQSHLWFMSFLVLRYSVPIICLQTTTTKFQVTKETKSSQNKNPEKSRRSMIITKNINNPIEYGIQRSFINPIRVL